VYFIKKKLDLELIFDKKLQVLSKSKSVKYALSFSDNTLILISKSTPLLIKIARNSEYSLIITVISIALQISE